MRGYAAHYTAFRELPQTSAVAGRRDAVVVLVVDTVTVTLTQRYTSCIGILRYS